MFGMKLILKCFILLAGDEYDIFDLADFKKKFKRSLQSALKNVSINNANILGSLKCFLILLYKNNVNL